MPSKHESTGGLIRRASRPVATGLALVALLPAVAKASASTMSSQESSDAALQIQLDQQTLFAVSNETVLIESLATSRRYRGRRISGGITQAGEGFKQVKTQFQSKKYKSGATIYSFYAAAGEDKSHNLDPNQTMDLKVAARNNTLGTAATVEFSRDLDIVDTWHVQATFRAKDGSVTSIKDATTNPETVTDNTFDSGPLTPYDICTASRFMMRVIRDAASGHSRVDSMSPITLDPGAHLDPVDPACRDYLQESTVGAVASPN